MSDLDDERLALAEELLALIEADRDADPEDMAMAEEVVFLVGTGAQHDSALHQTDEAKADDGEMSWCPGCRCIVLDTRLDLRFPTGRIGVVSTRLAVLESVKDDTVAQKSLGNQSRRDMVLAEALKKREAEVEAR